MSLKEQIDKDVKTALLAGDKVLVTTLRGLKSAILNEEVAQGKRDTGLPDTEVQAILAKEAKKRQESADLYVKGGSEERAAAELEEKKVIENYLPPQLSEDEIGGLIDQAISATGADSMAQMGQIIGMVKAKAGPAADGALIAAMTKERLSA